MEPCSNLSNKALSALNSLRKVNTLQQTRHLRRKQWQRFGQAFMMRQVTGCWFYCVLRCCKLPTLKIVCRKVVFASRKAKAVHQTRGTLADSPTKCNVSVVLCTANIYEYSVHAYAHNNFVTITFTYVC